MSYQQPTNNPYGANPPAGNDPYGQQPANPYGQPSAADPYAQASATPYGQPSAVDPYAQPATPYGQPSAADPYAQASATPYGQPSAADPYAQTGGSYAAGGYGQSAPATGYAQPTSDPYAATSDPYAATAATGYADPYAAQGYAQQPGLDPYGYAQPGYGMQVAAPRPKMSIGQSLKAFFQNYANFNGRANVSEFWPPVVFYGLFMTVLGVLLATAGLDRYGDLTGLGVGLLALMSLVGLAMIVPTIALYVRRLHDQNKSGWFYCLTFIPYVGGLIVFIMALVGKSDPAGARFDDPSGKQPATGN